MGNMTNVIQRHNATILNSGNKKATQPCNCRNKQACPLDGKCRSESIIYKATVESGNTYKHYYGLAEGEFKYDITIILSHSRMPSMPMKRYCPHTFGILKQVRNHML